MQVATPDEMRIIEEKAIETLGVDLDELMRRAGLRVGQEAERLLKEGGEANEARVVICCGKGNNGGDGMVAADYLRQRGVRVRVYTLVPFEQQTGAARAAGKKLKPPPTLLDKSTLDDLTASINEADLLIDGLFGFGFKGELRGMAADVARMMNGSGVPILAIDIPSGIEAESGRVAADAIKAFRTVSFTCPKLGEVVYPGAEWAGEITVADIGIPEGLVAEGANASWLTPQKVRAMLPKRSPEAHKKSCGRVLVIAGSPGLTGAAAMTSESALRIGAGLVTLALPSSLNPILETKLTEVMTLPLDEKESGVLGLESWDRLASACSDFDVLAVGPGLGRDEGTVSLVRKIVAEISLPLVLDADGINALVGVAGDILPKRESPVVLTPHPGELGRLLDKSSQEIQSDRIAFTKTSCEAWGAVVVLKGNRSLIAAPKGSGRQPSLAINSTGNPGLASAGTGDILTGFIAGLWGQGLDPFQAAMAGTFLHGLAGDLANQELTEYCLTATDLITYLPEAIKTVREE